VVALLFIAIGCARIVGTYDSFAATSDEPAHIGCGLEYVAKHVYKLESQHPPLTRAFVALLPYLNGTRPQGQSHFQNEGWAVLTYEHPQQTLNLARLGNLPFFVLGGMIVFWWSRRYFGAAAAAIATATFTLIPPVLAHAGFSTTDIGLSACLGAAFYSAIVWAERPSTRTALVFGAATSLSVLAKFSALAFLPACILIALLFYMAVERPGFQRLALLARERAPSFGIAVGAAIFVWWAGYLFSFGKVPGWNGGISVPAPEFWDGIGVVLRHNTLGHPAFLLGQVSLFGWWYYFPVALSVKTPLGILLLLVLGCALVWKNRRRAAWLMPPAFALGVLLPSMAGHINIGVRHVLPIYLAIAILAGLGLEQLVRWSPAHPWTAVAGAALALWIAVTGVARHPDYISYFNELVRRPDLVLLDSDYDWGQDYKRAAARLRQLGAKWVNFGYVGSNDQALEIFPGFPKIHPIHPLEPAEGYTLVSPTMYRTTQYGLEYRYRDLRPWFEVIPPQEKIGTLYLYYIPPGALVKEPAK
jgi:hypothetical protein